MSDEKDEFVSDFQKMLKDIEDVLLTPDPTFDLEEESEKEFKKFQLALNIISGNIPRKKKHIVIRFVDERARHISFTCERSYIPLFEPFGSLVWVPGNDNWSIQVDDRYIFEEVLEYFRNLAFLFDES